MKIAALILTYLISHIDAILKRRSTHAKFATSEPKEILGSLRQLADADITASAPKFVGNPL
jgi:hypothetical protein